MFCSNANYSLCIVWRSIVWMLRCVARIYFRNLIKKCRYWDQFRYCQWLAYLSYEFCLLPNDEQQKARIHIDSCCTKDTKEVTMAVSFAYGNGPRQHGTTPVSFYERHVYLVTWSHIYALRLGHRLYIVLSLIIFVIQVWCHKINVLFIFRRQCQLQLNACEHCSW